MLTRIGGTSWLKMVNKYTDSEIKAANIIEPFLEWGQDGFYVVQELKEQGLYIMHDDQLSDIRVNG